MKRNPVVICLLIIILNAVFCSQGLTEVDWDIQRTLKLKIPPRDMAVSLKGQWIYVLANQGTILVYSPDGRLNEKIETGIPVDQIKVGPREGLLLLMSKENRTVQVLSLDFVKKINIAGSPFKGQADAPVVIAVFSEFQ